MIYESSDMSLLNKKPFKLQQPCTDHSWSPTDLSIATYTPPPVSNPNHPARITVFNVPKLEGGVICQRNLRNIVNCRFLWDKKGDYLALKIDRLASKGKQDIHSSFEIFKFREKDIPTESLMLDEYVFSISWEPMGKRFAIVHSQDKQDVRPNVSVYTVTPELKKLVTIDKRPVSRVTWSPQGRFIVLAGTKPTLNGALEFYDVDEQIPLTQNLQHPLCSDIEWDPTGRYVVTFVSNLKTKMENGYKLWTFYGAEIYEERKNTFFFIFMAPKTIYFPTSRRSRAT